MRRRGTARAAALAGVVVVAVAVAGCAASGPRQRASDAPSASASASASASSSPVPTSPSTSRVVFPGVAAPGIGATPTASVAVSSPPVRLVIPAISVDTALQHLGRLPDGTLQSPTRWQVAGWYAGGVAPGDVGPAVIAGHIDSTGGPAVFFRLDHLRVGDQVLVTRRDGALLRFVVDGSQRFSKKHFPTETVYGPTPDAQLRLITCTGSFDAAARSYRDNLVVSTHLVSVTPARSVTSR